MKKKLFIIYSFLTIIVVIFCSYKIFNWIVDNKKNDNVIRETKKNIKDIKTIEVDKKDVKTFIIDYDKLKNENNDYVGWININNTNINYPIVHFSDNDYYLIHSFNKTKNSAGWPFIDSNNHNDFNDKNTVIYGHNRKDGSMFGTLKNTFKSIWYENANNKYITLTLKNKTLIYEVYSIYSINTEVYYITKYFNEDEFLEFINITKKRSIHDFKVDINKDDKILTLSTCSGNSKRTVLHAKLKEIITN